MRFLAVRSSKSEHKQPLQGRRRNLSQLPAQPKEAAGFADRSIEIAHQRPRRQLVPILLYS